MFSYLIHFRCEFSLYDSENIVTKGVSSENIVWKSAKLRGSQRVTAGHMIGIVLDNEEDWVILRSFLEENG